MPQLSFQRARSDDKKRQRAAALVEAARSLALESGVASVTLTDVASRAGVHYSAVRRYFTSHKEVLLNLAAEGWARFSDTVCESLGGPGPMSPARVAGALASSFLSRGVRLASDAISSVDCTQPPASKPRSRNTKPRAAITLYSLALALAAPREWPVITEDSYPFQNLPAARRILLRTCCRNAAVRRTRTLTQEFGPNR